MAKKTVKGKEEAHTAEFQTAGRRVRAVFESVKWFVVCNGLTEFVNEIIRWNKLAKPCPFCGGVAEYWHTNENAHGIQCSECEAEAPSAPEILEAIENWNRRAE